MNSSPGQLKLAVPIPRLLATTLTSGSNTNGNIKIHCEDSSGSSRCHRRLARGGRISNTRLNDRSSHRARREGRRGDPCP